MAGLDSAEKFAATAPNALKKFHLDMRFDAKVAALINVIVCHSVARSLNLNATKHYGLGLLTGSRKAAQF